MAGQKSQKGASDIVMKRKIYQQLLDWKEQRHGEVAILVEGVTGMKIIINYTSTQKVGNIAKNS